MMCDEATLSPCPVSSDSKEQVSLLHMRLNITARFIRYLQENHKSNIKAETAEPTTDRAMLAAPPPGVGSAVESSVGSGVEGVVAVVGVIVVVVVDGVLVVDVGPLLGVGVEISVWQQSS